MNDKTKIAFILGSLSRGGAERVTSHLTSFFLDREIEPYVITAIKGIDEYSLADGVKRIILSKRKKINYFALNIELKRVLKKENIDVLVIMDTPTCIYSIPAILNKKIVTIVSERNDPSHFAGNFLVKVLSRYLMKKANGFVFQTPDAKEFYSKSIKRAGTVIFNPIDVECLPDVWAGKKEKTVVSVGRFSAQKNQKMLIRAFHKIHALHPDYSLIIYGDGELRKELESLIRELGCDSYVKLPGRVNDITNRIARASVFAFSSNFEGMPNALIEAMAMGLPCLSTDCPCGGPRALIRDGINGFLTPVGNLDEFVKKLDFMLNEPKKMQSISREAILVRNELSVISIGQKWLDYILMIYRNK